MSGDPNKTDTPGTSGLQVPDSTPEATKTNLEIEKLNLEVASLKKKLSLEVEKLGLENKNLQKQSRWLTQFIPLATVLVGALGLVVTIREVQSGEQNAQAARHREETSRVENQIRADKEEVLKFGNDKTQTLSRASMLLATLNSNFDRLYALQDAAAQKRLFTVSLDAVISKELDFEKSPKVTPNRRKPDTKIANDADFEKGLRDVAFPATVLKQWPDYEKYLRENPEALKSVLLKYVAALKHLALTNPAYLRNMEYFPPRNQYLVAPDYVNRDKENLLYQQFLDIRNGFMKHLGLTADDKRDEVKKLKTEAVQKFEDVLCNDVIANQILGSDSTGRHCEK